MSTAVIPAVAQLRNVLGDLPRFAVAPFRRRWHLSWGATTAETAAAMPGDDLLPRAHYRATRAITVDAPPEQVWPWLARPGLGRGGRNAADRSDRPSWLLWRTPNRTFVWRLTPLTGQRTRLVGRTRTYYDWRRPVTVLLMELADYPMTRRMMIAVRERAETGS